jgi:uncharacterized protein YcnI
MKKILLLPSLAMAFLLSASLASAHAVVKPNQVGISAFQVFTLGVPSEKPMPTIGIRLMLPDGLNFVTPNVKAGWKVEVKTQATGKQVKNDDGMMVDEMKPVEIDWTGGSIPAGQRDEFSFQAQVPATAATLPWKVYQTYQDNSIMSWDQDSKAAQPKDSSGNPDFSKVGPYSQTQVVDDLSAATPTPNQTSQSQKPDYLSLVLSIAAIAISLAALLRSKPVQ